jgi:anhydro-N-acetylmuramic acid kinase
MSGTSCDGVDAALTTLARTRSGAVSVELLTFYSMAYPPRLRIRLLDVANRGRASLGELASLDVETGEIFAQAAIGLARKAKVALDGVEAIGSHGQTVFHGPRPRRGLGLAPATIQLGCPSLIALRTGCDVVADFRPADMAAGGEGAPLSPHGHAMLFRHPRRGRLILNLGGIANVSVLPPGARGRSPRDVLAFDTGPANMVLDALVEEASGGESTYDKGGRAAARGKADEPLLGSLLKNPYFRLPPPKSTGREAFGRPFALRLLKKVKARGGSLEDALATATALTAHSIAYQLERFVLCEGDFRELYLGGGGAKNRTLVKMLRNSLPDVEVRGVDELGIQGDALEAVIFALLAAETVDGRPVWLPHATGAVEPVILGVTARGRTG